MGRTEGWSALGHTSSRLGAESLPLLLPLLAAWSLAGALLLPTLPAAMRLYILRTIHGHSGQHLLLMLHHEFAVAHNMRDPDWWHYLICCADAKRGGSSSSVLHLLAKSLGDSTLKPLVTSAVSYSSSAVAL